MVVAHPTLERTWSSLKSFDLQNIKLSKKTFLKNSKKIHKSSKLQEIKINFVN